MHGMSDISTESVLHITGSCCLWKYLLFIIRSIDNT